MHRICLLLLLFCFTKAIVAQNFIAPNDHPKHEVRAVWLTTIGGIDWPHSYAQSERSIAKQQRELTDILDSLQCLHINTVLLQTRIRGTVIYPSQFEPWDGCLSGFPGRSPGYDALQFAINECHKRGMELHAWVVTMPVGKWNGTGCKRLRQKYPSLIRKIDTDGFMNPELEGTANYLAEICSEITRNYDVDGIHLDYIRYPETWKKMVSGDKARTYITRIVSKIHDAVKEEKPWVKMSCSPIGKYADLSRYWSHGWNAYEKGAQDAQQWLSQGFMDELFPMMYFRGDQFYPFAIDWEENAYGRTIAPGLGIYFLDPKEGNWKLDDIKGELYHLRNIGSGQTFFRNKFLLDNCQGIKTFIKNNFYLYPSLVPPMKWASNKKPTAPTGLKIEQMGSKLCVSWQTSSRYQDGSRTQGPYIYNNVYASRQWPVDVTDARNLIKIRTTERQIILQQEDYEQTAPLYLAITSMDAYGNESDPCQMTQMQIKPKSGHYGAARRLVCTDNKVTLPANLKPADCKYLVVKTLQNQMVLITQNKETPLNVSSLPDGVYLLKSVNYKNIEHTEGTFFKKTK